MVLEEATVLPQHGTAVRDRNACEQTSPTRIASVGCVWAANASGLPSELEQAAATLAAAIAAERMASVRVHEGTPRR